MCRIVSNLVNLGTIGGQTGNSGLEMKIDIKRVHYIFKFQLFDTIYDINKLYIKTLPGQVCTKIKNLPTLVRTHGLVSHHGFQFI
jgi:hypothetical protein